MKEDFCIYTCWYKKKPWKKERDTSGYSIGKPFRYLCTYIYLPPHSLHLSLDLIEQRFQLVHVRLLRPPLDIQSLRLIRFRYLPISQPSPSAASSFQEPVPHGNVPIGTRQSRQRVSKSRITHHT